MRKWILGTLAAFVAVTSGFASLENTTSAGLFFNNLDNVMDELDILSVDKNVSDLAMQGWNNSAYNTGFGAHDISGTVGLVTGLPFKLGLKVMWNENISGNPDFTNAATVSFLDNNSDGYFDGKQISQTFQKNLSDDGTRYVKLIMGLSTMSFSYTYAQYLSSQTGTFNVSSTGLGAASGGSLVQQFDLSGNLISQTEDLFGDGTKLSSTMVHTLTWATKMNNILFYVPVSFVISSGSSGNGSETNWTYNPGTAIPNPTYQIETYTYNDSINILGASPVMRFIMKSDPADYFEIYSSLGAGAGLNQPNGVTSEYNSLTTNHTQNGSYVDSMIITVDNANYRKNLFYLPVTLTVFPYFNKNISDKVRIGYGLKAQANLSFENYTSFSTNKTVTAYDNGDAIQNTSDSVITVTSYADSYTYASKALDATIDIPLAVQYFLSKVTTLRFGADLRFSYSLSSIDKIFINDQPTETSTVYGDGSTSYSQGAFSNPSSAATVDDSFTTDAYYYTGVGFALTDDLSLDVMLKGTWLEQISSFDVQLKFEF